MRKHYENQIKDNKNTLTNVKNMTDDKNVALMAVNCLYQYHDEFVLLLMKSQGSSMKTALMNLLQFQRNITVYYLTDVRRIWCKKN